MTKKCAAITWLAISLFVLIWWFYWFGSNTELSRTLRNESQIYLIIGMAILSFPIGLLYIYLFGLTANGLDGIGMGLHQYELLEVAILWIGFTITGYIQWFVFLPLIREKYRSN